MWLEGLGFTRLNQVTSVRISGDSRWWPKVPHLVEILQGLGGDHEFIEQSSTEEASEKAQACGARHGSGMGKTSTLADTKGGKRSRTGSRNDPRL